MKIKRIKNVKIIFSLLYISLLLDRSPGIRKTRALLLLCNVFSDNYNNNSSDNNHIMLNEILISHIQQTIRIL